MTTLTSRSTPLPTPVSNNIEVELEPDKVWKDALKATIENGMSSMIEDVKKNYQTELEKSPMTAERRDEITQFYERSMSNLRALARETYDDDLERERQERRWAAGVDMTPKWGKALVHEQQEIMNSIKGQKDAQSLTPTKPPPPPVQSPPVHSPPVHPTSPNGQVSAPPGHLPTSQSIADAAAAELAKERRERSLRGLERLERAGSFSKQSPPDFYEVPESQRQQEERARRVQDRKERERQEKSDQEKARMRKEKEKEDEARMMRAMEAQRQEYARAMDRERLDRERIDRERIDRERIERERIEKERMERARAEKRQYERELLEKQRLENEREKREREREREVRERERAREERETREREERETREREERETREREEREAREREEQEARERAEQRAREIEEQEAKERAEREARDREERETKEREEREAREREEREARERELRETENRKREERATRKREERAKKDIVAKEKKEREERQERERQEKEEMERQEKERLEKFEEARKKEEEEEIERKELERAEMEERERQEYIDRRDRQLREDHTHARDLTSAHDGYSDTTYNHSSSSSTTGSELSDGEDTELSDGVATDALELLLPPPPVRPITARKDYFYERPADPPISRSFDNPSRPSSASDRPTARSPSNPSQVQHQIWKPSSIEDDNPTSPLSAGLGRRNSATNIKSTGSAGLRSSLVEEPILERIDAEEEYDDRNARFVEFEETRLPTTSTPRERDKRREHRKSAASDKTRNDENFGPAFTNPRAPYRADDKPLASRDGYDRDLGYGSLKAHRSEEIQSRVPSSARPPLRREASFHEEYDDNHHHYAPSRPIRTRPSSEDRPPLSYSKPPPSGRVPSRPSSTLNDDRDYYDTASYRPYTTPPSSGSRSSARDHMTPAVGRYTSGRTEPPSAYGYGSEPRSNTLKYAEQSESPPTRRLSEARPTMNREPSYTQNFSEEPRSTHGPALGQYPPPGAYSRTYERAASASIPISSRQHRPSYGAEDAEGWKSWTADSHMPRRDTRRDPERRERYNNDFDDFQGQDPEPSARSGRDFEIWHPDSPPYYGPHPEPPRRESARPVRSPMASHPGSYHDTPGHSFGGRERAYEREVDSDEYTEDMETDLEPMSRYKPRREDFPRSSASEEDRLRRDPEDRRKRMAEELEHRRLAEEEERMRLALEEERKRLALEEEDFRREAKKQRKEAKRQVAEALRLEEEREQEAARKLKEKEEDIRRQQFETKKKAEAVRREEEEVRRRKEEARVEMEEAKRKEEEVKRKEEEARRKEEETRMEMEEIKRKEEEVKRKEEEAVRKEVAARDEARRLREENWQKEQEMQHREEELMKREEELHRREKEISLQKEAERLREEEESRREAEKLQRQFDQERRSEEQKKTEERIRYEQQQEEFRRREQEIQERRRQESSGASYATSPNSSTPRPTFSTANGQTSGWSSASKSSAASKASSTSVPKPRPGSNSTFPTSTPSPHPPSAFDEAEWKRRQEEQFQQQQERFRKDQQRFAESRQRTDGNNLTKEHVASTLERHERQWTTLLSTTASNLHWESIPWPMFTQPKCPDDITVPAVTAYMQSPLLPDKEKAKPPKDRIKDQIRKWHPDRFETKCLPRVIERERENVKEGTGIVIRLLNDLLTKVNSGPFG